MGNMKNDKKIALISLEDMAYTPIVGSARVHDCQDGMRHLEARYFRKCIVNLTPHGAK